MQFYQIILKIHTNYLKSHEVNKKIIISGLKGGIGLILIGIKLVNKKEIVGLHLN